MIQLSCPGKTFLCGEYGVLVDGRALVLMTEPRFQLLPEPLVTAEMRRKNLVVSMRDFHPDSPAGKLMDATSGPWSDFVFLDPYMGQGGFGASTAQFIFAYTLSKWSSQKISFEGDWLKSLFALGDIRKEYLKYSDQIAPPSGMDVLAQVLGEVSLVCAAKVEGESFSWPFPDLEFFIIPTGIKLATHEHLKDLCLQKVSTMLPISELVIEAFLKIEGEAFVHAVRAWSQALVTNGFLAETSANMTNRIASLPGVRAIKGCGAMGSDTLLALVDKKHSDEFKQTIETRRDEFGIVSKLEVLNLKNLSRGLEIH